MFKKVDSSSNNALHQPQWVLKIAALKFRVSSSWRVFEADAHPLTLPCSYPPPKDLECFDYGIVQRHIRLTKYAMNEMEIPSENIKSRKFGMYRRFNVEENVSLNYIQFSFNAIEYSKIEAMQQSCDADDEEVDDIATEESEDERQLRIRAMRRKRGTLKRLS